jgi:hypothetical protein
MLDKTLKIIALIVLLPQALRTVQAVLGSVVIGFTSLMFIGFVLALILR